MARSMGRVIITLDKDFADYFYRIERPNIGIIYLDVPNTLRTNPEIIRLLSQFFHHHAEDIDLGRALVVITQDEVRIVAG